jgi:hypothetical protein
MSTPSSSRSLTSSLPSPALFALARQATDALKKKKYGWVPNMEDFLASAFASVVGNGGQFGSQVGDNVDFQKVRRTGQGRSKQGSTPPCLWASMRRASTVKEAKRGREKGSKGLSATRLFPDCPILSCWPSPPSLPLPPLSLKSGRPPEALDALGRTREDAALLRDPPGARPGAHQRLCRVLRGRVRTEESPRHAAETTRASPACR